MVVEIGGCDNGLQMKGAQKRDVEVAGGRHNQ